ncbi:MAG: TetR/AcrR family transcriptional regulator [Pikeienuella sp.]|uniref:TetR/AcrR family transcriptional regulator n=1 Tax=Pikeienuella sp. TaxID=2831957 RepID=UPI00391AD537
MILRHAEDLFAHYGFSKTSMADIAERAGMSPGNLYRYYRNKQAIGVAVIEAFFADSRSAMLAAVASETDPEERVKALFRAGLLNMLAMMDRTPKIMELCEFLCAEDGPRHVLDRHIAWKRARVEAELAEGMDAGAFARAPMPETAVDLMHCLKAFQMPQCLAEWRDKSTIMPEFEGVLQLVFRGVRAKG